MGTQNTKPFKFYSESEPAGADAGARAARI